ncbi:4Fe-4S binding protein [Gordonia soli]|uniref:Putative ferredoxin--NADP(+) reductase n=1 Tax=Gordonia soli NBRC 108243 TaxID=1223545 RepID=M0QK51_9ACTN|nr:4Fe-4S binding protein [Gordonia soli]GAC68666.1 putative ferredoxin--NADP(+) reductase [Gordonia soli NBRC 108243]
MPHVVTQACCGDASCVYACPVNCIHPTPEEPDFGIAEMLYIDPSTCVDCGACVSACPVGAIVPGHRLTPEQTRYAEINAAAYGENVADAARFPVDPARRLPLAPIDKPRRLETAAPVSVGIVGSGPSAMYAADELLRQPQVRVTIYERLSRPFGLARYGVAPDHRSTRRIMELFDEMARNPRLDILLDTQVGRDLTLDDVRARHNAVLWAGGAPTDRRLAIPGADLAGVRSATSFVGWYNGHPDFADIDVDLDTETAVVIGNGNVALDVARILTADRDALATTSIAPKALDALRRSPIEEVVVLGRRGPAHAAFTLPELVGLVDSGASVVVDPADLETAGPAPTDDPTVAAKVGLLAEVARRDPPAGRRIRLSFFSAPAAVESDASGAAAGVRIDRTEPAPDGISVLPTGISETIPAGLVLTSIGYRGVAVPGLPFDESRGIIPNDGGRIVVDGEPTPGLYVTGWIKRGPTGFIGTNKTDSGETVAALLDDLDAGLLGDTAASGGRVRRLASRFR